MKHIIAASLLLFSSHALAAEYEIDPSHTTAQFSVRHMMVSNVRGVISKAQGKVVYDPKAPEKTVIEATLDPNTIDTRETKRDEHLRSPDFLNTAKFPVMSFKSKKVTPGANGSLQVLGDLTISGVTKEVSLTIDAPSPEVKDPWGNIRIGASATAKINRKDFGLTWNKILETGGVAVGEDVSIQLDVELLKKA